jgi:serine/threonine protein kinase
MAHPKKNAQPDGSSGTRLIGRRYEILELLGEGGMGQVFRVMDRLTHQQVALKKILTPTAKGVPRPGVASRRGLALDQTMQGQPGPIPEAGFDKTAAPTPVRWEEPSNRSESAGRRLSLTQEFQTLATMRHPNIINVLDFSFDEEQQPYFTMELLEDAQQLWTAAPVGELKLQIELLVQLLRAVAYLHRRGILHRVPN